MNPPDASAPAGEDRASPLAEIRRLELLLGTPEDSPALFEDVIARCHRLRNEAQLESLRRELRDFDLAGDSLHLPG